MSILLLPLQFVLELLLVPVLLLLACLARLWPKRIAIGLGPEPLVNYVYHKQALQQFGYSAETYVSHVYYITDEFDVRGDRYWGGSRRILIPLTLLRLWFFSVRRYRCVYHSFWGSSLSASLILHALDPWLYRLANVKVVILPYGGDVQELSRSSNLQLKHAYSIDYPNHRRHRRRIARQIDRWTRHADHLVGGCEWVDYMIHWDTLTLGHFAIDTERWKPLKTDHRPAASSPRIRILHAPNHRALKGTQHFEDAVAALQADGLAVEIHLLERVSNEEIRKAIADADIVADQLVVGWYAMFALEAMAMGKPVLCYLRRDLLSFYESNGLLARDEIPIVHCNSCDVTAQIRRLVENDALRKELGCRSREFVLRHHSLTAIGGVFDRINRSIGIAPDRTTESTPGSESG